MQSSETKAAVEILSAAFSTNPAVLSVFGGKDGDLSPRRLDAVHKLILTRFPGDVVVAKKQGEIVGVMRYVRSPDCQPSPLRAMSLLPSMVMAFKARLPKAMNWLSGWKSHHPDEPHWHLGPIAVRPDMQGQGVGSEMLSYFCRHVDGLGEGAYLVTDKIENVPLYERYDFDTSEQKEILGVHNWFMWRRPGKDKP